jgi:hypothetical protein
MSDLYDSGAHCFRAWAKPPEDFKGMGISLGAYYSKWLGPFNPKMTGTEANVLMDHVGKITESGQASFIRGWEKARLEYKASIP